VQIRGVIREGQAAQRRGVTEVPGLYFLGLCWQHTRGSALLGFVTATPLTWPTASPQQHAATAAKAGAAQQPSR
jgi:hypothetical protein